MAKYKNVWQTPLVFGLLGDWVRLIDQLEGRNSLTADFQALKQENITTATIIHMLRGKKIRKLDIHLLMVKLITNNA